MTHLQHISYNIFHSSLPRILTHLGFFFYIRHPSLLTCSFPSLLGDQYCKMIEILYPEAMEGKGHALG